MMDTNDKLSLAYKEAILQLREHPKLIWTRNNFFLLTQTGLLAFILNTAPQTNTRTKIMVYVAGLFLSLIWSWVNWAGRELQRQWRKVIMNYEARIFDEEDGDQKVRGPFTLAEKLGEGKLKRFSITLALLILSIGFSFIWIALLVQI